MMVADFETQIAVNGFAQVDGTRVCVHGVRGVTEDEAKEYIKMLREKYPEDSIPALEINAADGDSVNLCYTIKPKPFQRIRRITGYLVGTLDRFNNAKRAEESQRVKHSIE